MIGLTRFRLWDTWKRAETGPICPVKTFETKVLFPKARELVKRYGLKYDPENPVPTDDSLIDDIYKAAMELLLEVGVLCTDTERIIKFQDSEVKEVLRNSPTEAILGQGNDAVVLRKRNLEDRIPPLLSTGPTGAPISEDIALKLYQGCAQEPAADFLTTGFFTTIEGEEIKVGSPMELYAEMANTRIAREAFIRAGRPGMGIRGSAAVTVRASIAAPWRAGDAIHAWIMPEMKTDYDTLCRALYWMSNGFHVWGGGIPTLGGFAGGAEGTSIVSAAETIAGRVLYNTTYGNAGAIVHPLFTGTTSRIVLWSGNLASAAINKNSNLLTAKHAPYITYAGPCTEMAFYETATTVIGSTVVGTSILTVGSGRQGIKVDCCTPMETRLAGEVREAIIRMKMKRSEANEMVKALLAKYEQMIEKKAVPEGKTFRECYDIARLVPSKEYQDIYAKVKAELADLGLKFE